MQAGSSASLRALVRGLLVPRVACWLSCQEMEHVIDMIVSSARAGPVRVLGEVGARTGQSESLPGLIIDGPLSLDPRVPDLSIWKAKGEVKLALYAVPLEMPPSTNGGAQGEMTDTSLGVWLHALETLHVGPVPCHVLCGVKHCMHSESCPADFLGWLALSTL